MEGTPEKGSTADLHDAVKRMEAEQIRRGAAYALLEKPIGVAGDEKPRTMLTGRAARRARFYRRGEQKLERSRCQRSAERRGVRKVWAGR